MLLISLALVVGPFWSALFLLHAATGNDITGQGLDDLAAGYDQAWRRQPW